MTTSNKPPVHKVSIGRITVAIWQRDSGQGRKYFSVTVKRSFKTEEGEFKDTNSLDADDLPNTARALEAAHAWVLEHAVPG